MGGRVVEVMTNKNHVSYMFVSVLLRGHFGSSKTGFLKPFVKTILTHPPVSEGVVHVGPIWAHICRFLRNGRTFSSAFNSVNNQSIVTFKGSVPKTAGVAAQALQY